MGVTVENRALNAKIVLPEPFSGADYLRHQRAFREADESVRGIAAMLAVVESGTYQAGGVEHDLKAEGLDAPLAVLLWASEVVIGVINACAVAEKN
jgi:hypothetical protein